MEIVRPLPLRDGATIGVLSVSAPEPTTEETRFSRGLKVLRDRGFHVKVAPHAAERHGYMSATEEALASDLHELFLDPDIRAIICAGGGVNANRLLRHLDFDVIKRHPKALVGVSNPTVILNAITARTGLITFHGPSVIWDLGADEGIPAATAENFFGILQTDQSHYAVASQPGAWQWLNPGELSGRLLGGNLASVQGLLGTPYEPDWPGSVFAWEDIAKPVNRLDMMLTHFRDAGVFEHITGMIIGQLVSCASADGGQALEEMLSEVLSGYHFPVLADVPFGHTSDKVTLPLGAVVRADPDAHALTFQLPDFPEKG